MSLEWCFLGVLMVGALLLVRPQCRTAASTLLLCAGAVLAIASGVAWARYLQKSEVSAREFQRKLPHPEKGEYVSSENCRACHPNQYTSWYRTYHRTMTQVALPETVRGNFNDLVLDYEGDAHRVQRRGNEFWAELVDPDWKLVFALKKRDFEMGKLKSPPIWPETRPKVWKRIDMLTGSHHMQACWVAGDYGNQQFIFPMIYLFEDQRWVAREDAFLKPPNAERLVQVWNGLCVRCHATAGVGLQDQSTYVFQTKVAELGIACEACHGPAAEHVRKNSDPVRRYALHARKSGDPTIVNPSKLDAKRSSEVCGTCHGVKFVPNQDDWNAHGFRYRPGKKLDEDNGIIMRLQQIANDPRFPETVRKNPSVLHGSFWPDGMIRVSGREYNGLIETPCFQRGEMSCLSCHSMHQSDPDDQLAAGMEGNQACLQCHDKFGSSLASHTHHAPQSTGSSCYNCHMPHTTYGLLKAIRSHQVSSPSVASTLQSGRPNACNLCHLDKSLGWTATQLAEWYGIPKPTLTHEDENVSAAVTWVLRGDAGQRALLAWHMGWQPALEVSGNDWAPYYLTHLLNDPYAAVRYLAKRSLKRLPGFEGLDYDYLATEEKRRAVQEKIRPMATRIGRSRSQSLLVKADGSWETNKISSMAARRDDRSMELLE